MMAKNFNSNDFLHYPIGLRNNNPGNLRTGATWAGAMGASGGFVTFKDLDYGIRAAATVLINNIASQGNDTIEKLITKYAPPSENNTAAYINAVSHSTGIPVTAKLNTDSPQIIKLLHAIFEHENGATYSAMITDADISAGLKLLAPLWLMKLTNFFTPDSPVTAGGGLLLFIAAIIIIYFLMNKKIL